MTHAGAGLLRYTTDQLISWRKYAKPLDYEARHRVRAVLSRRGCRAGKKNHRIVLSDVDVGHIPVVAVTRPHGLASSPPRSPRHTADHHSLRPPPPFGSRLAASAMRQRALITVRRQRHDISTTRRMNFGCLNIRSLNNKLDDVLEVRRDLCIDVLFLVETWHDPDAVCIRRLRADGFHVSRDIGESWLTP